MTDITGAARANGGGRAWVWPALAAILAGAAFLRLYRLDQNGFGTTYYAAGVRSMMTSWHNLFFNAFDPAGVVSLDKPPVALWLQVASARLFGFSGPSVLVPQAIEGTISVALVWHLVRRRFGMAAGLLAALFMALTPVAVAIDRSNDTDSCMVMVLLLAAWAALVAAERASWRFLLLAMALAGLGFNVKMLEASVAVPSLAAAYWFGADLAWRRRLAHLALGGAVLAATSLSWCVAYDLTPPEDRPFVDSTQDNSMLELALGHNGIQRFVRSARPGGRRAAADQNAPAPDPAAANRRGGAANRGADTVPAGPLRLADRHLAGQFAWLLPLALIGGIAAWRGERRMPLSPCGQSLLLWSVWAVTYGAVFSLAGGIFHAYYLVALAPPLAALAGIGLMTLWALRAAPDRWRLALPAALAATMLWQAYIEYGYLGNARSDIGDWRAWLYLLLIGGGGLAAASLVRRGRAGIPALAAGLAALLATPAVWALSTVLAHGNVQAPAASLALLAPDDEREALRQLRLRPARDEDVARILAFLDAHRGDEHYLLATQNARQAAPLIIETGSNVLAFGGFIGTDPILTVDRLAALVSAGELRFVLVGGLDVFGRRPAASQQKPLTDWIRAHGTAVEPTLWRPEPPPASEERRRDDVVELFDLRPDAADQAKP